MTYYDVVSATTMSGLQWSLLAPTIVSLTSLTGWQQASGLYVVLCCSLLSVYSQVHAIQDELSGVFGGDA